MIRPAQSIEVAQETQFGTQRKIDKNSNKTSSNSDQVNRKPGSPEKAAGEADQAGDQSENP